MITQIMNAVIVFFMMTISIVANAQGDDPLPSWNEGPIKQSLIQFVKKVTTVNTPDYVEPSDRLAVFDNDGTLWLEQPMYTQVLFAADRIKTRAAEHPEWNEKEPFKSILNGHIDKLTPKQIEWVVAQADSGMTVEEFKQIEQDWLAKTINSRFHQPYTNLIYQPMLEVINYLRQHGFMVYIVSGGGQDFIRAYSEKTFGIPSQRVIGTAGKTKYVYRDGKPALIKAPEVLFIDDKDGKPQAINLFIGKKPIIAFGNSDGDQQMLEWTQSNTKPHLMLLVHHDDANREYAYGNSNVGNFPEHLMQEANENHWSIISMKRDWKVIFPFEIKQSTHAKQITHNQEETQLPSRTNVVPTHQHQIAQEQPKPPISNKKSTQRYSSYQEINF